MTGLIVFACVFAGIFFLTGHILALGTTACLAISLVLATAAGAWFGSNMRRVRKLQKEGERLGWTLTDFAKSGRYRDCVFVKGNVTAVLRWSTTDLVAYGQSYPNFAALEQNFLYLERMARSKKGSR